MKIMSSEMLATIDSMLSVLQDKTLTSLFSCVHRFIAQCIFSILKPTLPIESFINISTVNCSPCLQEKKIFFAKGPYIM